MTQATKTASGLARALLATSYQWCRDDLGHLRRMVNARMASESDMARLDAMAATANVEATPRYESGWIVGTDADGSRRFEAFLRPYSEDWYDLFRLPTWWEAMAKALDLAREVDGCEYVGNPNDGGAA